MAEKYSARDIVFSLDGVPVAQVNDVGEFGSVRQLIDASVYGDEDMDYVLGQRDGAEVPLVLVFDPADSTHLAVEAAFDDALVHEVNISHVDSGLDRTRSALITAFSAGGARAGLLQASVTLKLVADAGS